MEPDEVMNLFSKNYLESYYGEDFNEDLEQDLSLSEDVPFNGSLMHKRLEENTEEVKDVPTSSLPSVLGDGLAMIVNNPKFSRHCNPCDTEFEIEVWEFLVDLFNLPKEYKYECNGVGIINACETDGLLSLLITSQFLKQQELKDETISSDKFVVYWSNRELIYPIKRIVQIRDMTLRTFTSSEELKSLISEDKGNNYHPCFVIHDAGALDKSKFEEETSKIQGICHPEESKEPEFGNIWYHINLDHEGCFAMLDEYKYLTQISSDSVSVEASQNLGLSYESSLLWVKNKERIENGMHLELKSEQKFGYLSQKEKYSIDYKNFQVYLGKFFTNSDLYFR